MSDIRNRNGTRVTSRRRMYVPIGSSCRMSAGWPVDPTTQSRLPIPPRLRLRDPGAFGVDVGIEIDGGALVRHVAQVHAGDIGRHFLTGGGDHNVVRLEPLQQLLIELLPFRWL